jgi:hypothetical protein
MVILEMILHDAARAPGHPDRPRSAIEVDSDCSTELLQ